MVKWLYIKISQIYKVIFAYLPAWQEDSLPNKKNISGTL